MFLLGNGYAPVITVRDRRGRVLYNEATPFLPQDNIYRSVGAVKVTGASPKQLGFAGLFLRRLSSTRISARPRTFPTSRLRPWP